MRVLRVQGGLIGFGIRAKGSWDKGAQGYRAACPTALWVCSSFGSRVCLRHWALWRRLM